jgi:hypothetical protein
MNPSAVTPKKKNSLKPSAARMVESLRDTGYVFNTAVADITDNSVAAGATRIAISLALEFGGSPIMMIADNGSGMDEEALEAAMMYGSPLRPSPKSLGKFGMGLKTASTSFCRRLTVISRRDGVVSLRQWDLDEVVKHDDWVLLEPAVEEYAEQLEFLDELTEGGNGTLVVWENIDRLIRSTSDGSARKQMDKITADLMEHLSGVFYNFLAPENGFSDLTIMVNNQPVEAWDPFCRWLNAEDSHRLEVHPNKPFEITREVNGAIEVVGTFHVNIYILPTKQEMSEQELQKARYSLDNQGFHIFREGRMISSGGWPNRMFVKDPHQNLVRVELLFDHQLDDYFQIDIKKSRIDLPGDLRKKLIRVVAPARNEADRRYRSGSRRKAGGPGSRLDEQHTKSGTAIGRRHDEATAGSSVIAVDQNTGEATIHNKFGTAKVKIRHSDDQDCLVQTAPSLDYGVLWETSLVEGNRHAVVLNEAHEFYRRFYHANRENSMLIQAMDSVFWSLAEAELSVCTDSVRRNLEDLRMSVSRSLRTLAQDLPEAEADEEENEGENQ